MAKKEIKNIQNILKTIYFMMLLQLIDKMIYIELLRLSLRVITYFFMMVLLYLLLSELKEELKFKKITIFRRKKTNSQIVEEIRTTINNTNFNNNDHQKYFVIGL